VINGGFVFCIANRMVLDFKYKIHKYTCSAAIGDKIMKMENNHAGVAQISQTLYKALHTEGLKDVRVTQRDIERCRQMDDEGLRAHIQQLLVMERRRIERKLFDTLEQIRSS